LLGCVIEWAVADAARAGHDHEELLQLVEYGVEVRPAHPLWIQALPSSARAMSRLAGRMRRIALAHRRGRSRASIGWRSPTHGHAGDDAIRFWDLASGRLRTEMGGHANPAGPLSISRGGRWLAMCGSSSSIWIRRPPGTGQAGVASGHH
jgi:hypothetical protein